MQCPRCFSTNVLPNGLEYYVCMNPNCQGIHDGKRIHFCRVPDRKKEFPMSVIFPNQPLDAFIRKPYLEIEEAT